MKRLISRIGLVAMLGAASAAWAQQPQMTEEQKCQFECGKKMLECKRPCSPRGPDDLNDPKKKDAFMACSKDCNKQAQPCLDACKKEKKK